jgi:ElaB/YqjD/DUF883 family membrane-anchored ribosome-binding protein
MDMASLLKRAANFMVAVSILKWVAGDLKLEIRQDAQGLRDRANSLLQKSPYGAAAAAAAAGALTGLALAHRRTHKTIPTHL